MRSGRRRDRSDRCDAVAKRLIWRRDAVGLEQEGVVMADLEDPWEGTVATAARVAQWLAAGTQGLPGLYASLSGRAENKHGDTLFQAGARFFLFEMKGGPSLLSTEWTDTRVVVVDGKKERVPNPTPLHQAFVKQALGWNPTGAKTRRVLAKYSRPVLARGWRSSLGCSHPPDFST